VNFDVITVLVIFLALLIGLLIGISIAGKAVMKKRKIGTLVIDDSDPEKATYRFEFEMNPEEIPRNDYISIMTRVETEK
jgi:hypothetical protein